MTALAVPFTPGFVMHDYTQYNVVFSHENSCWTVSGLFDLAEALMGDGEADLSRIMWILLVRDRSLAEEFLRRYLAARPSRPGFAERFAVYMLDDLLYGWNSKWRREKHPDLGLRAWGERFTSAGAEIASHAQDW